jgi:glycosyltransferase involved in cell wall biosynthesis
MEKIKVLIIIPAFNEEKTIRQLVREIKNKHPLFSVLVINDSSTDRTQIEAENAGAFVARLPCNLGIGGAVQTGYKIAYQENYDIAVQIDGDGQHDPEYLLDVIQPIINDALDFSIGSRFLANRSKFKSTFARRIGIRFFCFLLRFLTGIPLTDPTSGFRAVNKKLIQRFAEYYPVDFPEPEAIKMAKRFGARIGEVPVNMRKRLGGVSSIKYFATFYYMIKVTFAICIDALKNKTRR